MSARSQSSLAILIGLGCLAAGLTAAEQTPPPVPWADIEAWATSGPAKTEAPTEPGEKPTAKPTATPTTTPAATPDAAATTTPPDEPEAVTPPVRPGDRRTPQAWLARYAQISDTMRSRLRATAASQYKQLFEINYLMEQYDKAIPFLTSMLKDARKWPEEDSTGWIAGRLWETALLQGGNLNVEAVKKYYDEWVIKERSRLKVQASALSSASLKAQELHFEGHQAFFQNTQNIAELIKQKEQEGETTPAALWEMCDRFNHEHPDVPVVHLRFLYKLREWYPNFPSVKSGLVQQRIAHALGGSRLHLNKEAAEEMENLLQKWPQANYSTSGYGDYYAAYYWSNYGDTIKAARDKAFTLRDARDAWQKALVHAQKVLKDFPKCPLNQADAGELSTIQELIKSLSDEDRLGSKIGK